MIIRRAILCERERERERERGGKKDRERKERERERRREEFSTFLVAGKKRKNTVQYCALPFYTTQIITLFLVQ